MIVDNIHDASCHTIHSHYVVCSDIGEGVVCWVSKAQPTDVQEPIRSLDYSRYRGQPGGHQLMVTVSDIAHMTDLN